MRKLFIFMLIFCFLFQFGSIGQAEASGKLILGLVLTGAGVAGIILGNEEVNVLKREYDFATYAYMAVWDDTLNVWISEVWDYAIDPNPETIVEEDIISYGLAYGTNNYDIYLYTEHNHHKVYETEKEITILGKMGFVATGIGVTLIIDYLLSETGVKKKAGIEVQTVTRPDYSGFQLVKRY